MKLTIRPLTPDLWPALENLFGLLLGPRSRRFLKRSKARPRVPTRRSPNSHPGFCHAPPA
jgi:hypothetical protein